MKRKDAVEVLISILKDWEDCKINKDAATVILRRIEDEIGMVPPGVWREHSLENNWDENHKKGERNRK